jgi:hypothetical protein
MISLQKQLREATGRWVSRWAQTWKDRLLACSASDCRRSSRTWQRFSNGAASLRAEWIALLFPGLLRAGIDAQVPGS